MNGESFYSNFLVGGLAGMGACLLTNPLDVVKTRLQLQCELIRSKGGSCHREYRGIWHALLQVARYDGISGLQKGLSAALCYQFIINSIRLGIFDKFRSGGLLNKENDDFYLLRSCALGSVCGTVGACIGFPFNHVKSQMQTYTTHTDIVHRRTRITMSNAFKKYYRQNGLKGLYHGLYVSFPRSIFSGIQIGLFGPTKQYLIRCEIANNSTANSFLASWFSGSVMSLLATPSDILQTRLFNQPVDKYGRGKFYTGTFDCYIKMVRTEGYTGLYKGFWPNYLRLMPHTTLVLFLYDQGKEWRDKYYVSS